MQEDMKVKGLIEGVIYSIVIVFDNRIYRTMLDRMIVKYMTELAFYYSNLICQL